MMEDAVRRKLLQPVGRHVQTDQFGQEREGTGLDVVNEVMVQGQCVDVGHPANGIPWEGPQVVVGQVQVLNGGHEFVKG